MVFHSNLHNGSPVVSPWGEPIRGRRALTGSLWETLVPIGKQTKTSETAFTSYVSESWRGGRIRMLTLMGQNMIRNFMTKWRYHTPESTVFSLETGSPAGSGCWLSAPLQQCNTPHSSSPAGSLWAPQASPDGHAIMLKFPPSFRGHWNCSPVCWEHFESHWWVVG